ncbi:hypothetical protein Lal_00030822 [Lupinus albus]|nr:hypothetical protein Lal_00030822 [Lupinus albus]
MCHLTEEAMRQVTHQATYLTERLTHHIRHLTEISKHDLIETSTHLTEPATMTRDNLYWLSHDQVALFKTFRGTASRCKQTINHAVPRIKQPSSLLYDFLLHCKNRSRIHPKIWLPVPIPNTHNIGFSCQFYSNN